MTKKKGAKTPLIGRPPKYSEQLAEEFAEYLAYNSIKKSCELVGITKETYYQWVYKFPFFSDLSIKARKVRAVNLFDESLDTLEEIRELRKDPNTRDLVPVYRLLFDGYLRLAGKANQGLFGDNTKNNMEVNIDLKDVDVPKRQTQKEWEEEGKDEE